MGLGHAKLARLGVHKRGPGGDAAGIAFGQNDGGVVGRYRGDAAQQHIGWRAATGGEEQAGPLPAPLPGGGRADRKALPGRKLALLDQSESGVGSHRLGHRCGQEALVGLARVERPARAEIDQQGDGDRRSRRRRRWHVGYDGRADQGRQQSRNQPSAQENRPFRAQQPIVAARGRFSGKISWRAGFARLYNRLPAPSPEPLRPRRARGTAPSARATSCRPAALARRSSTRLPGHCAEPRTCRPEPQSSRSPPPKRLGAAQEWESPLGSALPGSRRWPRAGRCPGLGCRFGARRGDLRRCRARDRFYLRRRPGSRRGRWSWPGSGRRHGRKPRHRQPLRLKLAPQDREQPLRRIDPGGRVLAAAQGGPLDFRRIDPADADRRPFLASDPELGGGAGRQFGDAVVGHRPAPFDSDQNGLAAVERGDFGVAGQRQRPVGDRNGLAAGGGKRGIAHFVVIEPVARRVGRAFDREGSAQHHRIVRRRAVAGKGRGIGPRATAAKAPGDQEKRRERQRVVNGQSHLQATPRKERSSSSSCIAG